jgi:transcriptional regulator with XRE-family HTH domain
MNPYAPLFNQKLSIEAEAEFKKLSIMEELLQLMDQQQISRSELAKLMGVGPSRITSMLSAANNYTMETLVRAGRALGAEYVSHFVPAGHQVHFSTCKNEDIHRAFWMPTRPIPKANTAFIIETSALNDETAAA